MLINSYIITSGCVPNVNEQYTVADAASDPNCNEANAIASGWAGFETNITKTIVTDPHEGTYAHKFEVTTGGSISYASYRFAVVSGETFTVSFYAKSSQGAQVRLTAWQNVTGGASSVTPTASYALYTYNITASSTGTAELRFYAGSTGACVTGDNIFIDNMSIIKTS